MRACVLAIAAMAPACGWAQEAFYAGKTITIVIGTGAGGGYDLYGRVLSRHLGKHLAGNPNIVVSNMPGAGSIVMANYMQSAAAKDGTVIGIPTQQIREDQLLGAAGARYDVRQLNWIGRLSSNTEVSYVWHTVPVQTIEDIRARETTFAGSGATSIIYARMLKAMTNLKWKMVPGYITTTEAHLALERGEVEGAGSSLNTLRTTTDWLDTQKVRIVIQYTTERAAALPNVPTPVEMVDDPADKDAMRFYTASGSLGRALVAPPGLPAARVAELRAGFQKTIADPEFKEEIVKLKLDLEPLSGEDVQAMIARASDVSPAVLERARIGQTP